MADVRRWTGTGVHRTRTTEWTVGERYKTKSNGSCGRYVAITAAKAECVCGWSVPASDRAEAQGRARVHRATVVVPLADLATFVRCMSEQYLPLELFAAFRRLDVAVRAGVGELTEVPLVDLRPLLREANRPFVFGEHPYIPRLIAAVDATSRWETVGMLDSVRGYCELVAAAHGLTWDEWIAQVAPSAPGEQPPPLPLKPAQV